MSEITTYARQVIKEDPLFQASMNEDTIGKRVAFNVKRIRRLKGLTQLELAEAMGVKQPFIARIESGKNNISIKKLDQIAQVFAIDPMVILRPIYEEGSPREVARLVVDAHFMIHAANAGAEIHFKEAIEQLVGAALKRDDMIHESVKKAFDSGEDVVRASYISRKKGILEKKQISVHLVRGAQNNVIGADVFCKMEY